MLIRASDWERIRAQFTEEEKLRLRAAVTGTTICPGGWAVDTAQVAELVGKIRTLLKEEQR